MLPVIRPAAAASIAGGAIAALAPLPVCASDEALFQAAGRNAAAAAEAFGRCRQYVDGWLAHADPVSGLIPRNLGDSRDGDRHPTRDMAELKLGDHSCEVINGLSKLYVACAHAAPAKREAYRAPLHELYDRLLEVAVNEHGLFHLKVNPRTGARSSELTDNWGYNYDGLYTVYLLDGVEAYRDAVWRTLGSLKAHYTGRGGVCQSRTADDSRAPSGVPSRCSTASRSRRPPSGSIRKSGRCGRGSSRTAWSRGGAATAISLGPR